MLLARVEGNVVATRKHPSLQGWRLVICQPIGADGQPEGSPQVAIDSHGAGMHQQVVISSDGAAARKAVGDSKSPVRWLIIGIVDEKEPGVRVLKHQTPNTKSQTSSKNQAPTLAARTNWSLEL